MLGIAESVLLHPGGLHEVRQLFLALLQKFGIIWWLSTCSPPSFCGFNLVAHFFDRIISSGLFETARTNLRTTTSSLGQRPAQLKGWSRHNIQLECRVNSIYPLVRKFPEEHRSIFQLSRRGGRSERSLSTRQGRRFQHRRKPLTRSLRSMKG